MGWIPSALSSELPHLHSAQDGFQNMLMWYPYIQNQLTVKETEAKNIILIQKQISKYLQPIYIYHILDQISVSLYLSQRLLLLQSFHRFTQYTAAADSISIYLLALDILFSSNHNIHKSLFGLCFWASDTLIERNLF